MPLKIHGLDSPEQHHGYTSNSSDVLKERAESDRTGQLLIYSLENTRSPMKVTYTALYEEAKKISCIIKSLEQFKAGHPILLHFDDHWDVILWFWSVLLAGGLPVLSYPFSNIEDDRHKHDLHLHPIESLLEESRIRSTKRNLGESKSGQVHNAQNGNHTACDTKCNKTNNTEDREDGGGLLMLMLTSGSTGNTKAVSFTHKQALAAISGKAAVRVLPRDRPFLSWIGLDHVAGLLEMHLQPLWLGVDQIHVNAADVVPSPGIFLDLLSQHRVSRTFAPNFFLAKLVSAVGSPESDPGWDLSCLVCVASGGEANDIKTCLAASALFSMYGAPRNLLTPGFGMTETCAGAISISTALKMRITTPQGGLAALNEPGDLEVRGPVVFKKYYRNPTATSEAFISDNWFRTGDRGVIDSNGYLRLVGRAKDVININGGDRAARLVVFASTASHTEQVTVAYIPHVFPPRDEEMAGITRLVTQACLMRTSTHPLVFALREQSLPLLLMSTLGKISRLKMARLFEKGEFAVDLKLHEHAILRASKAAEQGRKNGPKLMSESEARLLEHVAETLGLATEILEIDIETSLFDIGYTSMHIIKLKYYIERGLGIDVSVINIMKNHTIRALAAYLDAQLQHSKAGSRQQAPSIDSYDPVVVFRAKGSKTPLWLIHPGVGEVLVFVGLAQCLAVDDRPVFALRAAGFESDHQRFRSIKQAVDVYIAAIRRRQPHGPYALAGYSYGTMLAFEAAKRLGADGEEVRFLGSFNLPPHIKHRLVTEDVSGSLETDPAFRAVARDEAIRWVLDIGHQLRWKELALDTSDALARWVDVSFGIQQMSSDYDPSGQVNTIDVFYAIPLKAVAKTREIWLREHLSRWSDFAREPPRFHAVGGEHYTMIGPDHVARFSKILVEAMKARGV
ncbi:acetyl-CoA synthetase-like protein [Daldinia caldariorum]|uniref:acetyl-CoA synthetase-like protein n=1 Tax=Daldinia caldariorum TaxID=326644 RepID=UPI00200861A1|nr:acetyl-CoA synthetase-like protein [Daldinia caldariorum]KAI1470346.1 acetyl-CoA synthetase-like protein [Daldinia caldariorum]